MLTLLHSGKPNTSALSYEELGAPLLGVLLEPGDLLYMPRGYPHDVTTAGSSRLK